MLPVKWSFPLLTWKCIKNWQPITHFIRGREGGCNGSGFGALVGFFFVCLYLFFLLGIRLNYSEFWGSAQSPNIASTWLWDGSPSLYEPDLRDWITTWNCKSTPKHRFSLTHWNWPWAVWFSLSNSSICWTPCKLQLFPKSLSVSSTFCFLIFSVTGNQ